MIARERYCCRIFKLVSPTPPLVINLTFLMKSFLTPEQKKLFKINALFQRIVPLQIIYSKVFKELNFSINIEV